MKKRKKCVILRVVGFGLPYAKALVLILTNGLFFILLTVTGLRKKIFDALSNAVRIAILSGIGLFITILGLQNAGKAVSDSSTCADLAS